MVPIYISFPKKPCARRTEQPQAMGLSCCRRQKGRVHFPASKTDKFFPFLCSTASALSSAPGRRDPHKSGREGFGKGQWKLGSN